MGFLGFLRGEYEKYRRARGNMENLAEAGKARIAPGRGEIFHISEGEAIFFICSEEDPKKSHISEPGPKIVFLPG